MSLRVEIRFKTNRACVGLKAAVCWCLDVYRSPLDAHRAAVRANWPDLIKSQVDQRSQCKAPTQKRLSNNSVGRVPSHPVELSKYAFIQMSYCICHRG